jgi:hypothetical protein
METVEDRPDKSSEHTDDVEAQELAERNDRIGYCEITGHTYVKAPPGARKITSEEIREMLEDFP